MLPSPGSGGCSARGMLSEGLNLSLGSPLSSLGLMVCLPSWPQLPPAWEGVCPPHLPPLVLGLVHLHQGHSSKGGHEPWEHPAGTSSGPGQEFMATWKNNSSPNRSETSLSMG